MEGALALDTWMLKLIGDRDGLLGLCWGLTGRCRLEEKGKKVEQKEKGD